MTASATEAAFLGLVTALNASANLPDVRRDAVFDDVFESLVAQPGIGRALVLRAGDAILTDRALPNMYELTRNAEIEFLAAGPEGAALNAAFDEGVSAIFTAVESNKTLGGAVSLAEIVEQPELGTDQSGARAVLTALVRVELTFTSSRAY